MKAQVLSFTVLCMVSLSAYGQVQNEVNALLETKNSGLEWSSTEHDFGEISQGVPVEFSFELKNNAQEAVIISSVRTSCGCTAAGYAQEPVLPGKTTPVKVTYNAQKVGVFTKTVTVILNGTEEHRLTIKGAVKELVQ